MTGWDMRFRVSRSGAITIAALHDARILAARMDADGAAWSYGEGGTASNRAGGDVAIDEDGDVVTVWAEYADDAGRVLASASTAPSKGRPWTALAVALAAILVLVLVHAQRRRRSGIG
jgi:hypothetical protein